MYYIFRSISRSPTLIDLLSGIKTYTGIVDGIMARSFAIRQSKTNLAQSWRPKIILRFLEIALVLVCCNHVASIVNANHSMMRPAAVHRIADCGLTVGVAVPYTADFLPLTISASAGKFIVPLTKYLRAASATACFTVGS